MLHVVCSFQSHAHLALDQKRHNARFMQPFDRLCRFCVGHTHLPSCSVQSVAMHPRKRSGRTHSWEFGPVVADLNVSPSHPRPCSMSADSWRIRQIRTLPRPFPAQEVFGFRRWLHYFWDNNNNGIWQGCQPLARAKFLTLRQRGLLVRGYVAVDATWYYQMRKTRSHNRNLASLGNHKTVTVTRQLLTVSL